MSGNLLILACDDFRVEAFHSGRSEGRLVGDHFIQDAAETPDVRAVVVGLVLPHFGAGVVWRARLGSKHTAFRHFGHVQIAEFNDPLLGQEQVRTLDIPVANFQIVKGFQPSDDLNQVVPDFLFIEFLTCLLLLRDQLEHVPTVGVLHHDAEAVRRVLEEGLLVADHIGVVDAREDAHLIQGVLLFFAAQFLHFDLFHSVNRCIRLPHDLVNLAERALTCVAKLEIRK